MTGDQWFELLSGAGGIVATLVFMWMWLRFLSKA